MPIYMWRLIDYQKKERPSQPRLDRLLLVAKGANQAACGAKLSYPTYFVGQVGEDAHGRLITEALKNGGVNLDCVRNLSDAPTGHAVVMLQPDGQNSIIIVGGANMSCWPEKLSDEDLEVVRKAGVVLLQREIPDLVNIQVAKVSHFNDFSFNSLSLVINSCLVAIMFMV
ncbi:hypothetical protein OIU76_025468 [Salix suchowensis]|nr:hypothetical protein OIU76_025468 [Salix suchowensis]